MFRDIFNSFNAYSVFVPQALFHKWVFFLGDESRLRPADANIQAMSSNPGLQPTSNRQRRVTVMAALIAFTRLHGCASGSAQHFTTAVELY